jgi:hypothetical protein
MNTYSTVAELIMTLNLQIHWLLHASLAGRFDASARAGKKIRSHLLRCMREDLRASEQHS